MRITEEYLKNHVDHIFVFGDNLERKGKGGAANLRDLPNTFGFITKKAPNNLDSSFYKPEEYLPVFLKEMCVLVDFIRSNKDKQFLISKLGSGLANRYGIFDDVIELHIINLLNSFDNVKFLW